MVQYQTTAWLMYGTVSEYSLIEGHYSVCYSLYSVGHTAVSKTHAPKNKSPLRDLEAVDIEQPLLENLNFSKEKLRLKYQ